MQDGACADSCDPPSGVRGSDATEMMNPPLREHALAGHAGQLLERNQEASQKEMPCESAGRCQEATELGSAREYMADPSSRPYEGTGGTDTGAPGDHSKIPGGLGGM